MTNIKSSTAFVIRPIEDGIFNIYYSGAELTQEMMMQLYDELEERGNGNRVGVLNTFKSYVHPKEKVMEYIASDRPRKIIFASAFVPKAISMQLVMRLFMEFFNKQKVARKTFINESKAIAWLRKMRDEERK